MSLIIGFRTWSHDAPQKESRRTRISAQAYRLLLVSVGLTLAPIVYVQPGT